MGNTKQNLLYYIDDTNNTQIHTLQFYTVYATWTLTTLDLQLYTCFHTHLTKQPQPQLAKIQSVVSVHCSFSLHVNSDRFLNSSFTLRSATQSVLGSHSTSWPLSAWSAESSGWPLCARAWCSFARTFAFLAVSLTYTWSQSSTRHTVHHPGFF